MAGRRPTGHPRGCACAPCAAQRAYQREWARRHATPERRAKQAARYRIDIEASRAEGRRRAAADLASKGAEIRARRRTRYASSPGAEIARAAAWRKANPEAWAATVARRRAKTQGRPDPTKALRLTKRRALVGREPVALPAWENGSECYLCGTPMFHPTPHAPLRRSIDHIQPIAKGGRHETANLAWVHRYCNAKKHTKEIRPGNVPAWFRSHLQQRLAQKGGIDGRLSTG